MHLLLLSGPPSEVSLKEFKAAYGPGLKQVFSNLIEPKKESIPSLDIALVCSSIPSIRTKPRGEIFIQLQSVLKHLYSLIAALLAEQNSSSTSDGLDIHVYIVYSDTESGTDITTDEQGPIFSFRTFATASRPWTDIYAPEGEVGEKILQRFIHLRTNIKQIPEQHRVAAGSVISPPTSISLQPPPSSSAPLTTKRHISTAVGGTFDHLHLGHKLLLTSTAMLLDPLVPSFLPSPNSNPKQQDYENQTLIIGITAPSLLLNKSNPSVLQPWSTRESNVLSFLHSILHLNSSPPETSTTKTTTGIILLTAEIHDPYGPTITMEEIDSLVVSAETRKGGEAVNERRRELGWKELDVFEVSVLDGGFRGSSSKDDEGDDDRRDGFAGKISSTEIRRRIVANAAGGINYM